LKLINSIRSKITEINFGFGDLFACFAAAFIIASSAFALRNDFTSVIFVRQYSLTFPLFITVFFTAVFAALTLYVFKSKQPIKWILLLCTVFFSTVLAVQFPKNPFFCLGLAFIILLVIKYVTAEDTPSLSRFTFTDRHSLAVTAVLAAAFTAAVYFFTATKYNCFAHSTFDFGIFCQMFDNMAETGLPMTTVERGKELSHFAVHFSPFYYVLLPGYLIFRSPLYLLFVQALGIALGAFAVRRICKALELSPAISCAAAAAYLLFPTMANGCFWDFHENKFLSVLILWALAFILEKNRIGAAVFLFLILTVKEDAFIYVLAICLWMIVTKRDRAFAFIACGVSVFWFFFSCNMIQLSGGEIMSDRFAKFSADADASLFDALRTCFIDIGFLIKEVFAGANTERFAEMTYSGQKLEFIWWTCTPLLFAPFLRKRSSELVLLIPMLVINLMPEWMYQYNVGFQYTYGTCALLIFSTLLFLRESGDRLRRATVISMVCISIVFSASLVWNKAAGYVKNYDDNRAEFEDTVAALAEIPEDSSVTAYGYMTSHLYYIDELQTVPKHYGQLVRTDYFVIDTRYEGDKHNNAMYACMGDAYELVCQKGYVKIYRLAD